MARHCSTCREALNPERTLYRCSVASCNAGRLKMRFCSERCFEKHVPTARHRSADCVEIPPPPAEQQAS